MAQPGNVSASKSLAWLGAGNGNDLELTELTSIFEKIHLVDADQEAIEVAARQVANGRDRIQLHAPIDIAAPLLSLSQLTDDDKLLHQLGTIPNDLPVTNCDVVVSAGLLSQLMFTLTDLHEKQSLDEKAFFRIVHTVRRSHLDRITAMLRPGGMGIITCDLIASDSIPELLSIESSNQTDLQQVLARLAKENLFFTGMNPAILLAEMGKNASISEIAPSLPWVWKIGGRTYLVMAIIFRRTA